MTTRHYITRPTVFHTVQWDGTNIAELHSVFPEVSFTDNGDGTVSYPEGTGGLFNPPPQVTATAGQWISSDATGTVNGPTDDDLLLGDQQVPSAGPLDYTVNEVTP
jgi:hypothetical protein